MYLQRYKKYICFLDMMNYNIGLYKHVHRPDHLLSFWFIYKPKNTYPRLHWDMVICHRIFSIFSIFLDFLAGPFWVLVPFGNGPFWVLVPFGWSLLAGPLWLGPFWLPMKKRGNWVWSSQLSNSFQPAFQPQVTDSFFNFFLKQPTISTMIWDK